MGNDYGPFLDYGSHNDTNSPQFTNKIQDFDQQETNLAILISQNFDKKRSIDALKKFRNVEEATEYLMVQHNDEHCMHGDAINCEYIANLLEVLQEYDYKQAISKQLQIISQLGYAFNVYIF